MSMSTRTVARLFDNYSDAAAAVRDLEAAGFSHDDVSLVANRPEGDGSATAAGTDADGETGAGTGAGTGATLGTILGGGAGPGAATDRSGTTAVGPSTESGQAAVRMDDGTRTAATPQPGANSFTEGQARSRIEAAGFANVTELQKDDQGIWRGRGMRDGRQVSVALDFTGAVTSQ